MSHVTSFPPIAGGESRLLILGTMPGRVSLREQQYYAHPRNAFWQILGNVVGFDPEADYPLRVAALIASGFAVWDVLRSCVRDGSLDSAIEESTLVPNDFAVFFAQHTRLRHVCFNGAKAEALYRKHVQPGLREPPDVQLTRLPSTSPANATVPFDRKLHVWRRALQAGGCPDRNPTPMKLDEPVCTSS